MQDRVDEQMFYLKSCFCIYQKMLSKDEDIFLETFMVSALKKRNKEIEREIMMIAYFDKQNH